MTGGFSYSTYLARLRLEHVEKAAYPLLPAALFRYFRVHGQASMQMPQIVESIAEALQNSVAFRQQARASKNSSR
jgi:hypothetical protein